MADFTQGYEKTTPQGQSPKSASGTEKQNQEKGPGPEWAKREKASSSD